VADDTTLDLPVVADLDRPNLDRLIFEGVVAYGNSRNGFNEVHRHVCVRVKPMLPVGALTPGGDIHDRMIALINEGRLSYAKGRLTLRETVEQHRCRERTYDEVLAVAGAEDRRRGLDRW
jgi:hypothetical protein